MNKKSQAAMEFLIIYGWAIFVILIALGALAYFGVFDSLSASAEYKRIANNCSSQHINNYLRVACVKDYFENNYEYDKNYPCEEAGNFYKNVFAWIGGIKSKKINLNDIKHTVTVVSFDNQYCILDIEYLFCRTVK